MASAIAQRSAARSNVPLRELGIYSLPDGKEYVVSTLYSDGFSLYPTMAWDSFCNAEYWVSEDGRIFKYGIPTLWTMGDLKDTGRTTHYPKPNIK